MAARAKERRTLLAVLSLILLIQAAGDVHLSNLADRYAMACREGSEMAPVTHRGLQRVLDDYSARYQGIGLQATVILANGAVWSESSGSADLRTRCPMSTGHHLFIGSITKLYTATLVMQEVERGVISLDDPISKWISLPNGDKISVQMLLSHRSGLPDYAWDPWFDFRYITQPGRIWTGQELVEVLRGKRLVFKPGTQYQYSNSNYLLLGQILEKVNGKPYGELVEERLRAIGLTDSYFGRFSADVFVASGYDESLLHLGRIDVTGFRRSTVSGAYAAGGILSTSADVARFAHLLFTGQILQATTLMKMKAFWPCVDDAVPVQTGYGLGVRRLQIGGADLVGHTGTVLGYSGIVVHNESKGNTLAVLSNLSSIDQIGLLKDVQDIGSGNVPPWD